MYKRVVKRSKKFYAHDEDERRPLGDVVQDRGDASASQVEALAVEEIRRSRWRR